MAGCKSNTDTLGKHGLLKRNGAKGQSHHLNQDAAYRDLIPTDKGAAIKLKGNAFTQPGTPHYEAHKSLEQFWDQYRKGGALYGSRPTNLQYTQALKRSLEAAGLPTSKVAEAIKFAIHNRVQYGALGGMKVPRIPGRINQVLPYDNIWRKNMSSLIPEDIKQEILSLPWFVNTGKSHLINNEFSYISDKKDVTKLISSINWENTSLEASNDMYAYLYKKNLYKELDIWEKIVTEARQFISNELLPIIPEIKGIDMNYIKDDVSWNIMHFILERYFKKQLPSDYSFFTRIFYIYKSGYLVCGLQGQYPEGNLLVY